MAAFNFGHLNAITGHPVDSKEYSSIYIINTRLGMSSSNIEHNIRHYESPIFKPLIKKIKKRY